MPPKSVGAAPRSEEPVAGPLPISCQQTCHLEKVYKMPVLNLKFSFIFASLTQLYFFSPRPLHNTGACSWALIDKNQYFMYISSASYFQSLGPLQMSKSTGVQLAQTDLSSR